MRSLALLGSPLGMLIPLLLWGAHLLFVYGVLAVGCAVRPEGGEITLPALWFATLVAVALLAWLGYAQYRHFRALPTTGANGLATRALALRAGPIITLIALVAVVWTALPLLFIDPCG